MVEFPPLVCPMCRATLETGSDALTCSGCDHRYPVVAGIPDLRLRSDRYLDLEADRAKARRLASHHEFSFPELVREYWKMTPEVPADLAERFTANAIDGVRRAQVHLDELGVDLSGKELLDVGCGTAGLLVAAARHGATVNGVDIALRWLVVAARHLRDAGVDGRLVAADGATLPFTPGSFDVTISVETLEHAEDQAGLAASLITAARPDGRCYLVTANRFSVAPEPSVRLWGVGFLPRRLAPAYVRLRRGTGYRFVRPLSGRELRRSIGAGGRVEVSPAPVPPPTGGDATGVHRVYERLRGIAVTRALLARTGPFLQMLLSRTDR